MKLNVITFLFALILISVTQVLALFIQYRENKNYKGIGYWLLGSSLMTLGFILMPLVVTKGLDIIAIIANPLLILGHIFFYIGIKRFFDRKVDRKIGILIFLVFNLFYYYHVHINNNISLRTIFVSGTIAIISFMILYELSYKKDRFLSSASKFIRSIFLIYGILHISRILFIIILKPENTYDSQAYSIIFSIIVSIIISNLWTFGLIIIVNQKLNIENQSKKEKLQLIFNMNIDALLITRLEDGLIIEVNDELLKLSGYSKEEIIGNYVDQIGFWDNQEKQKSFMVELNKKESCKNMEFIFQRKDETKFEGVISARIIIIDSIAHVISVIRDITERRLIESKMERLVKELEIEKNTAQFNAITDSLTGLFNRGYFDKMLRKEFFRLRRSGGLLSLVMLDIDYFKKFNDNYGHVAGDETIQMISTGLKDIVDREADIVARYGGEEFILILPETGENGARIVAERIRGAVEKLDIPHVRSETAKHVTVSLGVVTVRPCNLESPEEVLKLVDKALYEAKEQGRNRCVYKFKGK